MALVFTEENFESEALKSDKLVMVDFWAEWCGPCRMVGPLVEELSKEYDGKAVVGKVNVDLHGGIAAQFGVRNIPTIVFLKNGELVDKVVGAVPKDQLAEKLDTHI
jgi:thioredoxin 1